MRIISLFLGLCLTINVMASTGTAKELERILDEYQYSMTVEWDQKDQAYMTEATESFYNTLATLMEKGLTQEEVINLVSKKASGTKGVEALKLKLESVSKTASSPAELVRAIADNSKGIYATGASWEGYIYVSIGLGVVIAAAIGYSIWWNAHHTCVATAQGQQCGWVSHYQGGPQYYQCWQTTYCTEYVKH
jgi:phosphoribosyl-ATP pyrophosphohydrolase